MTTAPTRKWIKARLTYLCGMLAKYSHRWGETQERGGEPSQRMYNWVDEYNDLRETHKDVFAEYCDETGAHPDHDAYDCLA